MRTGVLTSSKAESAFVVSRGTESDDFLSKGTEESVCGDCDSGEGTETEDNGDKAAVGGVRTDGNDTDGLTPWASQREKISLMSNLEAPGFIIIFLDTGMSGVVTLTNSEASSSVLSTVDLDKSDFVLFIKRALAALSSDFES